MFCPHCEADIPAHHVDLARLVAPCRRCGATADIADQVEDPGDWMPTGTNAFAAPQPAGITLVETDARLTIERRWLVMEYQGVQFVMLAIGIAGVLVILAARGAPWWLVAILAALAIWRHLKWALNRSLVTVGDGRLRVEHRPMSGPQIDLDAAAIVQLYTSRRAVRRHRRRDPKTALFHYDLSAISNDGSHIPILKSIADQDQATYMEREIERRLRIEDHPVRGEITSLIQGDAAGMETRNSR